MPLPQTLLANPPRLRRSRNRVTFNGHQINLKPSTPRHLRRKTTPQRCPKVLGYRITAARTRQTVATIFDDQRLDLGQFPHLMPQRLGITPHQPLPAPPTSRGLQLDDTLTLRGGNQRPLAPGLPRRPSALPLRLPLRRSRLRLRMLGTGRRGCSTSQPNFAVSSSMPSLPLRVRQSAARNARRWPESAPASRETVPPVARE